MPIRVYGVGGRFRDTYCLLDPGSGTSLINTSLMEYLGLQGSQRTLRLDNVESSGIPQASTKVSFYVSPRTPAEWSPACFGGWVAARRELVAPVGCGRWKPTFPLIG